MKKEFIPYEQALELKELGFNEECLKYYLQENDKWIVSDDYDGGHFVLAPLYQQSFRWFREKYDLFAIVHRLEYLEEYYYMWVIEGGDWGSDYDTYENAELACLKKLIEIAKNKQ